MTRGYFEESEAAFRYAAEKMDGIETGERGVVLGRLLTRQANNTQTHEQERALAERGLSILCRLNARREMPRALRMTGWANPPQRPQLFAESLALARELDNPFQIIQGLIALAEQAIRQLNYPEAIEHLHEALAVAQATGNRFDAAFILRKEGLIMSALQETAEAQCLWESSLAIARELQQYGVHEVWQDLNNLAGLFGEQGDYARAEQFIEEALAIVREYGNNYQMTILLDTRARYTYECGEYQRARSLYQDLLALAEPEAATRRGMLVTTILGLTGLDFVELARHDAAAARHYFRRSLDMAVESSHRLDRPQHGLVDALVGVAGVYIQLGQSARALDLLAVTVPRPVTDKHSREEAHYRAALEAELGAEAVAAAIARGQDQDFVAVARAVLVDLEGES